MSAALLPGATIDLIEIRAILGAGFGAIAYDGQNTATGESVVVKEYFPLAIANRAEDGMSVEPQSDADAERLQAGQERFFDMYDTLGSLSHPSLPKVLGLLEANGTSYAIMARVEGESLEAHALKAPGMFESRIRAIFGPLLAAVEMVHNAGVLHLGIHPGNIWLPGAGLPVLLGFRPRDPDEPIPAEMVGYAPVEQADGETLGVDADLHALGMSMLRCVSGRPPATLEERFLERRTGSDPIMRVLQQEWRRFTPDFLDAVGWMTQPEAFSRPQGIAPIVHLLDPHEPAHVPDGMGFNPGAVAAGSTQSFFAQPLPGGVVLEPEQVDSLKRHMQGFVGPLASAVVNRGIKQSANVDELMSFLLDNVPDSDQEEFAHTLENELGGEAPEMGPDDFGFDDDDEFGTPADGLGNLGSSGGPSSPNFVGSFDEGRVGEASGLLGLLSEQSGRDGDTQREDGGTLQQSGTLEQGTLDQGTLEQGTQEQGTLDEGIWADDPGTLEESGTLEEFAGGADDWLTRPFGEPGAGPDPAPPKMSRFDDDLSVGNGAPFDDDWPNGDPAFSDDDQVDDLRESPFQGNALASVDDAQVPAGNGLSGPADGVDLQAIERCLTSAVGPIGRVMLRRALQDGGTEDLVVRLAEEIGEAELRTVFLSALGQDADT